MKITKVYRGGFARLNQSQLVDFVNNVLQRCDGNPTYAALQDKLAYLKTTVTGYSALLAEGVHGGTDRVARKNMAKAAVRTALQDLCYAMEYQGMSAIDLINAGLQPAGTARTQGGEPAKPENLAAASTGTSGEIEVAFTVPNSGRPVRTNAIEWSADGGQHWSGGVFSQRGRTRLPGLPNRREVQVRVCSVGSRGRRSGWTEPVTVFVL